MPAVFHASSSPRGPGRLIKRIGFASGQSCTAVTLGPPRAVDRPAGDREGQVPVTEQRCRAATALARLRQHLLSAPFGSAARLPHAFTAVIAASPFYTESLARLIAEPEIVRHHNRRSATGPEDGEHVLELVDLFVARGNDEILPLGHYR